MSPKSARTRTSKATPSVSHDASASARVSTVSYITSASDLSKSDFSTWALLVGLDNKIELSIPSSGAFQEIRDLKDLSNRFPTWLAVEGSPQLQFIHPTLKPLADEIHIELAGRRLTSPTHFLDGVHLEPSSLHVILIACHHMRSLSTRRRKPTEMDRRLTIDVLMAHICGIDCVDDSILYGTEQELKLPQTQFESYNVTKTKADGVMYLDVHQFGPYTVHPSMGIASTAFHTIKGQTETLEVVHCVAEFKKEDDGSNQAMMGMVSGLYQRRVLQRPEQFVFGVLHFQKFYFRVIAGIWQEDKIKLYEIGCYSMNHPLQALKFYLVLRDIHRRAGLYLGELRRSERSLTSRVTANPPSPTWCPPRMGSITEDPGESNQQPPHQGGANTQQETSEQRHVRHKVQSYLKTLSSSSAFLPASLPPTPKID